MDEDRLRLETIVEPGVGVTIAAHGYLDKTGGEQLARESLDVLAAGQTHLRIDLENVPLFNCSGARHLVAAIDSLQRRGREVELVGANSPLQTLLHLNP